MNTIKFLLNSYNAKGQKSPIMVYNSRNVSLTKLFKKLGFTTGAEIGVARGYFSRVLCQRVPNLKLYCVDAWKPWFGATHGEGKRKFEKVYLDARQRLAPFNCEIIRDWSAEAVKRFKDESLDFVYIDCSHDYKSVIKDIKTWSKKVKKGGIVAGHDYITPKEILKKLPQYSPKDYNKTNYDVKRAVNTWVKKKKIKKLFVFTKDLAPSWFYVK